MMEVRTSAQHTVLSREAAAQRFDIHSWNGLAHILQAAREGEMKNEAYNELRDLVLVYAQSGGDQALKAKLESIITHLRGHDPVTDKEVINVDRGAHHGTKSPTPSVQKVQPTPKETTQISARIGAARPRPAFATASQTKTPYVEEVKLGIPDDQALHGNVERKAPQLEASIPEDLPVGAYEPMEQEIEEKPDAEVLEQEITASVSSIPESEPSAESTTRTEEISLEAAKSRIAEIKRSVNETLGNPAVLISTYNETGRAYMRALLDALKASSGGQPSGSLTQKMKDLEAAYTTLLADEPQSAAAPKEVVSDAVSVAPEPLEEKPVIMQEEINAPIEAEAVQEQTPAPPAMQETREETAEEKAPELLHERIAAPEADRKIPIAAMPTITAIPSLGQESKETEALVLPKFEPRTTLASEQIQGKQELAAPETPMSDKQPEQVKENVATPKEEVQREPLPRTTFRNAPEVSKARLPDQQETILPSDTGELMAPEITQSLGQLLKEWDIFRSSGMFGMGPGGIHHPLYEQLATLPMAHVIAGRWEHSDLKTKQSIKDYVDAWRHEQGITYTPNETFENYLRRVIQRILKRQRGGL